MTYTKIYKTKIEKTEKKLFDLGWRELLSIQKKFVDIILNIFENEYETILKDLKTDQEIKINDLLNSLKKIEIQDNKNFIKKMEDFILSAFNIWKKAIDKLLSKDVEVVANFGIKQNEALAYAIEKSAEQITKINSYTRERINNLITKWIQNGYWYNKIAEILEMDYSFSKYRARLIASNELGTAYIQGKRQQFNKYREEFGQPWWKKWVSHRDDKTTEWCLENDNQWWIMYDQEYPSGHQSPPRFTWCRCNEKYSLFKPE